MFLIVTRRGNYFRMEKKPQRSNHLGGKSYVPSGNLFGVIVKWDSIPERVFFWLT